MLMKIKLLCLFLLTAPFLSTTHATERLLTPFERIQRERAHLTIDVTDANANELIPRILERTGLQYTFIRSPEDRILSLKTKADPTLVLETIAFAAGFNIHKNGNYWVIHPLPTEPDFIN
jgi:hypothetical protein